MMHAAMHGKNIHGRFVVSISCIEECMVDSGNIHEESIKLIAKFQQVMGPRATTTHLLLSIIDS